MKGPDAVRVFTDGGISLEDALTNGHNIAVLGATQTGKTSFVRELHATTNRLSIWVNERGKHRVPDVEGRVCRTIGEVKQAMADDEWRIEFLPADRKEAIVELQEFLWQVAERTNRQLPVQVIVDEIDRVAPQSQKNELPPRDAVRTFTSEGVKRNIKFVGITQDPTTYDKKSLRQSRYRAVWIMATEQQSAVSDYGFSWDRIRGTEQFAGVLHHMSGSVIGEVKANAKYAE